MLAELKDHVHRGPRHGVNPGPKVARAHSADHKRALSAMRHCISLFHHFIDIALEAWIREHRRINAETLEEVFERLVPYILKIPVEGSVVDLTRILAALQSEKVLARLPLPARTGISYGGETAVQSNCVEQLLQMRIRDSPLRDLLQKSLDGSLTPPVFSLSKRSNRTLRSLLSLRVVTRMGRSRNAS